MSRLGIALGAAILLIFVAYIGHRVGRVQAAIEWSWVTKEHQLLAGSMERIQHSLAKGDTNTVYRAVSEYNVQARSATNDYGYLLAATALWNSSTNRP